MITDARRFHAQRANAGLDRGWANAPRAGRVMPVRRDLDAVEMRDWLGRLCLCEILNDVTGLALSKWLI